MQPRAILFDKDGTLVGLFETWMPAYRRAAEHLAAAAGDPRIAQDLLTRGGYDQASDCLVPGSLLSCGSNSQIAEAWQAHPQIAALPDVEQTVLDIFYEQTVHHAVPVTALRPLFTTLRARGLKLGVATMDNSRSADECLRALGVRDLLDFVCGYDDGYGAKPEPGMAHAFAAAVGHSMDEVMVVGDAVRDLHMARNAGCAVAVGVLTGAAHAADLQDDADHVLPHIGHLVELLDRLA